LIYNLYYNFFIYDKIKKAEEKNKNVTNDEQSLPVCVYDITSLADVSDSNTSCCTLAGIKTGDRIFNFDSHDYIISKSKTSYYEACISACEEGVLNGRCIDDAGEVAYNSCLLNTQPVNCVDTAKPIGKTGTDYWYVKSYSNQICPTHKNCSD
jgi:hypothetical protein